jgi:hypothetical protein
MKNHTNSVSLLSFDRVRRSMKKASLLSLPLLLSARLAAAADPGASVHTTSDAAPAAAVTAHDGWSFNATPVLVVPDHQYGWGGGADPEVKYTLDLGPARVSVGGRVGAYYAKNLFGLSVMPTLRLMVPMGALEPYVSAGVGYGWLPKTSHADVMTMARAGFLYRFSKRFAVGLEFTLQQLRGSEFRFPSVGSMMAFDF